MKNYRKTAHCTYGIKRYIDLLVSVPPYLSVSKLVQYIKGRNPRKLYMEHKEWNKEFWGRHLWERFSINAV